VKLADVMSAANLAIYAEVALVLFLLVFLALVWRLLRRKPADWDHVRQLPLDDGEPRAQENSSHE
jgi:cbb3-type cytochrome oxidase subunit 3